MAKVEKIKPNEHGLSYWFGLVVWVLIILYSFDQRKSVNFFFCQWIHPYFFKEIEIKNDKSLARSSSSSCASVLFQIRGNFGTYIMYRYFSLSHRLVAKVKQFFSVPLLREIIATRWMLLQGAPRGWFWGH